MLFANRDNRHGAILCCLWVLTACPAMAAEWSVTCQGDDANSGTSVDQAFRTIQKGVDALKPGDTLTIGPGEYAETVRLPDAFGDLAKETAIRATIPGTVLLRGDRDIATVFEKVPGKRFVYVTDWDVQALFVVETDTLKTLLPMPQMDALEFGPGRYCLDVSQKKLYISTTDLKPPGNHHYAAGVLRGNGFHALRTKRVVFDGLAARGFQAPVDKPLLSLPTSGFLLHQTERCTVRNCVAFFNRGGIILNNANGGSFNATGKDNTIESCEAFGNSSEGICGYNPCGDTIRHCRTFLNFIHGARFYGALSGDRPCPFTDNLSWGNGGSDFWFKGKGLSGEREYAKGERCVAFKGVHIGTYLHGVMGSRDFYSGPKAGTVKLPTHRKGFLEVTDRNFADPLNFDFRLQATSEYRRTDKGDDHKGPYPFKPDVFYVKPDGDDSADGLSVSNAWRTLGHAFETLAPGTTLYLCEGTYPLAPKTVLRLDDVTIRGRARGRAAVEGSLTIADCKNVALERIYFSTAPRIAHSGNISLDNCVIAGKAPFQWDNATGVKITHCLLSVPVKIKDGEDTFLRGNVFLANPAIEVATTNAIVYSDYNAYSDKTATWMSADATFSLVDLRAKGFDNRSRIANPTFDPADNLAALEASIQLGGCGPLGSAIGPYLEWKTVMIEPIVGPFLYSVDHESANIECWTAFPMELEVSWGETPDCPNKTSVSQQSYFSYSLSKLKSETKYYVKLKPKQIFSNADSAYRIVLPETQTVSLEFTTSAKNDHAPTTYFLSNDGNDANSGLSRNTAWKTLQHAADRVKPGDTVLLAGGTYSGGVYFRTTGTRDKPITVKAIPGEKVVIDGENKLHVGLILYGKEGYHFDGLYLQRFPGIADNVAGTECGAVFIKGGSHIQLTRCHISLGWGPCIVAEGCEDLVMKNCVVMHSMTATSFSRCKDLVIENNVFVNPLIFHLRIGGGKAYPSLVRNNIFGENTRGKVAIAPITLLQSEANNCFYSRWPEQERQVFGHRTLSEYNAQVRSTDTFIANPQFPDATGWRQGWGPGIPNKDFNGLFACNPELVKRGIGLQSDAFKDFHFWTEPWPYTVAWAETIRKQIDAADDLARGSEDEKAMNAYLAIANQPVAENRMKAELFERAALLADKLGDDDKAIQIAEQIPFVLLAARCQMNIMTTHEQYETLIKTFAHVPGHGRPYLNWSCPETEVPLGDFYYYRGMAYAKTGKLDEAEADLKIMLDKTEKLRYHPGTLILDTAAKRLGDFYRDYRMDDDQALAAYTRVIDRMTFSARLEPTPKPVLTGGYPILAEAAEAAVAILEKQGKLDRVREIRFSTYLAQAKSHEALNNRDEAVKKIKKALAVEGIDDAKRKEAQTLYDSLTAPHEPEASRRED